MDAKTLAQQFRRSSRVLDLNLSELSNQDSLVEPAKAGNCLNWVLGHLTRTRSQALVLMGREPLFPVEDFKAYTGLEPFNSDGALPFEELKRRFKALQEPLITALENMPREMMDSPAPFSPSDDPNETVGSLLGAIAFHEAYHAGQTGLLRRVIGREGKVKPPRIAAGR